MNQDAICTKGCSATKPDDPYCPRHGSPFFRDAVAAYRALLHQTLYGFSVSHLSYELDEAVRRHESGSMEAYGTEWEAAWADLGAPSPPEATSGSLSDQSIDPAAWDRDNRAETEGAPTAWPDLENHHPAILDGISPSGQVFWTDAFAEAGHLQNSGPPLTHVRYDEAELLELTPEPNQDCSLISLPPEQRTMLANIARFYLRNAPKGPLPAQRTFAESLTKDRSWTSN
jgi:hypothetical protein